MNRIKLLLAVAALLITPSLLAQYHYSTVDFPDSARTRIFAINNLRQYVGAYWDSAGDAHAMFFDGRTLKDLGLDSSLGPVTGERAFSLNNRGSLVGQYKDASGVTHGYVFHNGVATPIDYPGAVYTAAYGINDFGHIIGIYYDANWQEHAYLLRNGKFKNIDAGTGETYPLSINDWDEIVGEFIDVPGTAGHGYLQLPNGKLALYDAPNAPANSTLFISISNLNHILGEYYPTGTYQNFVLANGKIIPFQLEVDAALDYVSAQTINDRGDVVGWYRDTNQMEHGFVALRECAHQR